LTKLRLILLIIGILLLIIAFINYVERIVSCYPPLTIYAQYNPEQIKGFREACQFDSSQISQFGEFLAFFIPGIIIFSVYWLSCHPRIRNRRSGQTRLFLLILMIDSLLVMLYGLLGYPEPGILNAPASWAVEVIATLGFACYLATLALWHWKRWGLILFQGASITLAAFVLLGGGSQILAAVITGGVIILSLIVRPIRNKLV
jgi:hypothetical protein